MLVSACSDGSPVSPTEPDVLVASFAKSSKGSCRPDSKLIGRIALTDSEDADAWWGLTRNGLIASGVVSEADQLATMEGWFGEDFGSLDEAIDFLVAAVKPVDANDNGFVCAYNIRGTRTSLGDPLYQYTLFKTLDDNR
jgi:hypothetical protein